MKNILVTTDFSECANNALRYAAFMARKTGATIHLLHALEVPTVGYLGSREGTTDDAPFMMALLKATKNKMKQCLSLPFLNKLKTRYHIEVGGIIESVDKAAEYCNADLIITGTHGGKSIQKFFIGNTPEKIIKNSRVPVITIKDEIRKPKIERIIFATDFSEESEKTFPAIYKLAEIFGAEIELVKVVTRLQYEPTSKTEKAIELFRKKFPTSRFFATVYYDYNKQEGIKRYALENNADLIVISKSGKHGLSGLFKDTINEELINKSSIPVLTINHKEQEEQIEPEEILLQGTAPKEKGPRVANEAIYLTQMPWI